MTIDKRMSTAGLGKLPRLRESGLKNLEFIKRREVLGALMVTDSRLAQAKHSKSVAFEIDKLGVAIEAAGPLAD